ncbi:hypothetical protein Bca52824_042956 [Brassica carinata]|uniref:Pentatricopeptide repeat-containing protein n=1 Tax=Brassica carinata TaxID=52824 RepID=A0A8X7RYF0_BRACI|nr:hypothetical protein Bca52824_042956 [Brassica carinata]
MPVTSTALLRMLRECRTLRCILQVHGKLTVSGLKPHNQLINAYSLFQRPNFSRIIFDSVQDPGVVLCNSMIRGYTRAGLHREALELFRYMSEEKSIVPDKYSFTFALKASTGALDLERGLGIHELVSEMGFESDVYIGTALVEMYCKGGDLVRAREVFDEMPERDVVTWNIMVSALRLFRDMCLSCVEIDHIGSKDVCRCLHGFVVKKGFTSGFSSGLIDMYCKCADLDAAECVFEDVSSKDDSSWGAMMAAYAHNGCFTKVLEFFDVMRSYDVRVSKVAVVRKGIAIHEYVVQHGMMAEVSVVTSLVSMYSKCGELEIAEQLFRNTKDRDVVTWSAMIASFELAVSSSYSYHLNVCQNGLFSPALKAFERLRIKDAVAYNALAQGYTQIGDASKAFDVYHKMKLHGVCPDSGTMVGLLQTCALCSNYDQGSCVYGQTIKHGFDSECHVAHALIDMFTKCHALAAAKSLFDKCGFEKSTVSWNIMMNGYLINGQAEEAIAAFHQMKNENFQPNIVTFVNILHAAAQLAVLRDAMSVHARLIRFGYCSHTAIGNGLVDMYAKCGMIESSERCFVEIRNKDMVSWNTMLSAYAVNGLASCAFSLFLFMQENQLRLDSVPFLSVLSACRHAGLVEEGKRVGVDHYACMVDLLGKAGLFGGAVEIVRRMRVKANVGVWGALLNCSRMHCNLWLSNAALCQLVKLEPLNLSHYGQELRLGDANDGSRIKKIIPACSWIQV